MIENFGKNMARLRKEKGMNQEELALKLGVSKQTISTIEKGDSYPTFKNLEKISKILNASPIQLFGTQKEIAVSDTPMILDKIDEYDNKVQNILRAEKFIDDMQSYINGRLDQESTEAINSVFELANAVKDIKSFIPYDQKELYQDFNHIFELAGAIKTIKNNQQNKN